MEDPYYEPANQYEDETDAVRAGLIPAESVYCEHGTYVGSPYGGDYLCHWCEDGVSMAELQAEHERAAAAGELCDFRGSRHEPDGRTTVLLWHVYCTPCGPCPHVVQRLTAYPDPIDITEPERRAFWLRAGGFEYHA